VSHYEFPQGFAWGVATASYQIEGAVHEDGRKDSVWDAFSRRGGTRTGESGAIACDHYHRYESDVALMASLGVKHYRMSIAWPRVIPDGRGAVNEKGLAFYERLVDCLLKNGITPYVTLFHWDHPQALEERYGGWRSREIVGDYADYVTTVVKRLGDRVTDWFTHNEVMCFTTSSYGPDYPREGCHAPGVKATMKEVNTIVHHAMLAHGKGVQAIRAATPKPCRVALVDNSGAPIPITETAADIEAAKKAFQVFGLNGQVLWPAIHGAFSPLWLKRAEAKGEVPDVKPGDLELIKQPLDRLGFNVYSGGYVRAADNAEGFEAIPHVETQPRMNIPWLQIMPEAIYWVPRLAKDSLGFAGETLITENGAAALDHLTPRREVLDTDRVMFLKQYFRQLHRLVADGYPMKGYFLWSFMDNFEWSWGYAKRFGIVFTNYETQERIPKQSAKWYAEVIKHNRVV